MAVQPNQRGNGIGNKMMQFALRFAEQHHWKKCCYIPTPFWKTPFTLPQVWFYQEVPLEPNGLYSRGNIKMEIKLNRSKNPWQSPNFPLGVLHGNMSGLGIMRTTA